MPTIPEAEPVMLIPSFDYNASSTVPALNYVRRLRHSGSEVRALSPSDGRQGGSAAAPPGVAVRFDQHSPRTARWRSPPKHEWVPVWRAAPVKPEVALELAELLEEFLKPQEKEAPRRAQHKLIKTRFVVRRGW